MTHTHTLRHWFSVRLNCHDGKEGEGTERCMSQPNSIVENCFGKRSSESDRDSTAVQKVEGKV